MLIEILIAILLGVSAGTLTGLIPGIHINLVGTILVALSATLFAGIEPVYLIVFIASMAIAHTFVDFIPSVFLGCPDADTQLSILPGHELLKEGKGYEAVMLTAVGGVSALAILLVAALPISAAFSKVYELLHSSMFWVLLIMSCVLIFAEANKIQAAFVFILSGALGWCVLNLEIKEPLLPLLTGLFGSSMIIQSIKSKIQIPKQEITFEKCRLARPLFGSVIASPLCGFLPGLGSGQAAVLGNTIAKTDRKGFLILVGATNTLVMGISFIALYAISKARTGAAAAVQELIGTPSAKCLIIIILAVAVSGAFSFFITKNLAKILANKINKINYTYLSIATLILVTTLTIVFSGPLGLLVLIASTFAGISFNSLPVKKTHMMGCLLIPTMIYYAMRVI